MRYELSLYFTTFVSVIDKDIDEKRGEAGDGEWRRSREARLLRLAGAGRKPAPVYAFLSSS
jgi:hypothetical protein